MDVEVGVDNDSRGSDSTSQDDLTSVVEESGVIFVPKKDGRLRIIFDTRNPNKHFAEPYHSVLGTGEALSDLETCSGVPIYLNQGDVECCFY